MKKKRNVNWSRRTLNHAICPNREEANEKRYMLILPSYFRSVSGAPKTQLTTRHQSQHCPFCSVAHAVVEAYRRTLGPLCPLEQFVTFCSRPLRAAVVIFLFSLLEVHQAGIILPCRHKRFDDRIVLSLISIKFREGCRATLSHRTEYI